MLVWFYLHEIDHISAIVLSYYAIIINLFIENESKFVDKIRLEIDKYSNNFLGYGLGNSNNICMNEQFLIEFYIYF